MHDGGCPTPPFIARAMPASLPIVAPGAGADVALGDRSASWQRLPHGSRSRRSA